MAIVPSSKSGLNTWAQAHVNAFTTNAVAIGLTPAQATTFSTASAAYNTTILAQEEAYDKARAATEAMESAEATLRAVASDTLSIIKGKANSSANPSSVYGLAQIPSPSAPSPAGPPTDATNVAATLKNNGAILITWEGTLAKGQFFSVWRKLSTNNWDQIGVVAAKKFADNTLPIGSSSATYMVQSHRGEQSSFGSEPVQIVFGSQSLPQAA
ncbi:MAG: hypothetical protein ABL949_09640 [Fimbriimonadaceae bacterium]